MSVLTYSTTPGSNGTALASGGSLAEGATTVASVNDKMRQILADIAMFYGDSQTGVTTGGTASAYTVSTASGHGSYANSMAFRIRAHVDCAGGATTMNVNSLGVKSLKVFGTSGVRDPRAGEIKQDMVYDCAYVTALNCIAITGHTIEYSVFGASIMAAADAAAVRTLLGLVIGTNVQAFDASLSSLSGLSLVEGDILYATAADTLQRLAKGTAGQILRMNTGATAPEWGGAAMQWATPVNSTSGNIVDINLAIPAGVSEVILAFRDVSLTTGDNMILRLGTSGGFVSTGYTGAATLASSGFSPTGGFGLFISGAGRSCGGHMFLHKVSGNIWSYSMTGTEVTGTNALSGSGYVDLAAALTQARIITTAGNFDAGVWNIGWR